MPPPLSVSPLLIAQLRNGSEQAFQSIYQQYHQAVYRFAYAFLKNDELSKEVTQETFLSLWIHRQDLSETLPLYPYLFNKARRLTIDAFRRITTASRMQQELITVQETLSNETEDTVLWNDLQQITVEILKSLPKQQQMVFKLSRMLVDTYWTLQGRPIDQCPLHTKEEYELNPSLNRDPRYGASIMGPGDTFYGEKIDIYTSGNPMYYENQRASKSGYWFRKLVPEDDAFREGTLTYGLLRYAEVLLTYAEAKMMLGEVDELTKSCINQVRARAGLDMSVADVTLPAYSAYTQDQWITLLRNERRIEFAGEGLRYEDILRWRLAEQVMNQPALGHTRMVNGNKVSLKIEDRSFAPNNYLWPFHQTVLRVEPHLKQNPGY